MNRSFTFIEHGRCRHRNIIGTTILIHMEWIGNITDVAISKIPFHIVHVFRKTYELHCLIRTYVWNISFEIEYRTWEYLYHGRRGVETTAVVHVLEDLIHTWLGVDVCRVRFVGDIVISKVVADHISTFGEIREFYYKWSTSFRIVGIEECGYRIRKYGNSVCKGIDSTLVGSYQRDSIIRW